MAFAQLERRLQGDRSVNIPDRQREINEVLARTVKSGELFAHVVLHGVRGRRARRTHKYTRWPFTH